MKKKFGILMKKIFVYKIIAKNFGVISNLNFGLNDNPLKTDQGLIRAGNADLL